VPLEIGFQKLENSRGHMSQVIELKTSSIVWTYFTTVPHSQP
jgi:hypothetical protein